MESGVGRKSLKKNQKGNWRRRLRWERTSKAGGSQSVGTVDSLILSRDRSMVVGVGGMDSGLSLRGPLVSGPEIAGEGPKSPEAFKWADSFRGGGAVEGVGPIALVGEAQEVLAGRDSLFVGASVVTETSNGVVGGSKVTLRDQEDSVQGEEDQCDLRILGRGEESSVAEEVFEPLRQYSFLSEVGSEFVTPIHGVRKAAEGGGSRVLPAVEKAVGAVWELGVGLRVDNSQRLVGRFWVEGSGGSELEHYTPLVFGEMEVEQSVSRQDVEGMLPRNSGLGAIEAFPGPPFDQSLTQQSPVGRVAEEQGEGLRSLDVSKCGGEIPLLRWKRFALVAAMCILAVRAVIVQLAFFLHMQTYVYGRPAVFTRPLIFATAFMSFFSVVIALFKDIPDIDGDRIFGIQSFSVRLGQKRVFWICVYLLQMAYGAAVLFGAASSCLWSKFITINFEIYSLFAMLQVLGHGILASVLWSRAKSIDLKDKAAITSFYMFIWKLFYAEYFLIPLVR
ncbi:hypothetical protein HHK36_021117 [Tetracentron sinense]|uniref:Uncharacterized protein n=1 Tax=Tetracentron sinense TaxID=13715 RepID=A0A835D722_TETSI|nr:hypothetical protein HHK36_021117 [Tetracentron sinense]